MDNKFEKYKILNVNVLLCCFVAIFISANYFNLNKNSKKINVSGNCVKKVKKDKFTMDINIKNLANDSSTAVTKSLSTYKIIATKLKLIQDQMAGTIDIGTSDYSIREKYEYNRKLEKDVKQGVESIIGLKIVTSNNEALVSILNVLKDYKDVYTDNFANIASNNNIKIAKEECLKEAVIDATRKAKQIADTSGQKLGKLFNIYINSNRYEPEMYKVANLMLEEKAASSDSVHSSSIFQGTENVNLTVSATFELN